jgi:hypothetical protein
MPLPKLLLLVLLAGRLANAQISTPTFEVATIRADQIKGLAPEQDRDLKRRMVQALLADRFHLAVHRETRTLPAYDLILAKNAGTKHLGSGGGMGQADADAVDAAVSAGEDLEAEAVLFDDFSGEGDVAGDLGDEAAEGGGFVVLR